MNGEQVLHIILAILGVYFLYTVFITKENKLFGGENQVENEVENEETNILNNNVTVEMNNSVDQENVENDENVVNNSELQGLEEDELYNVDLSNSNVGENSGNGCASKKLLPEDLLPKDQDNIWASGNDSNINYLESGHHIGINTVGQSLKNANRQIRSEPANPRDAVSPWNQSTIEPDSMRKQLELGEGETRNSE